MSKDPLNDDLLDAIRTLPLPLELHLKIYRFSQDAWIQEIASLMGEIYETLAKMRVIHASQIEYPRHAGDKSLDMEMMSKLGASADVISLYQQLPYITAPSISQRFFAHPYRTSSGSSRDSRDSYYLARCRIPCQFFDERGRK